MSTFLFALAQAVWSLHGCAEKVCHSSEGIGDWTCSGNWRARAR